MANIVLNQSVAVLKDEFDANGNPTQTGDTHSAALLGGHLDPLRLTRGLISGDAV